MLGGTWALANCSPTTNSKCASWVESNSGRRCSLVMPEGPPAEPRLDDRNVRKKKSSSSLNSSGTKVRKSSGIGSRATLGRLMGFRNSCRVAVPSRHPRGPAWLKTTPQPEREPNAFAARFSSTSTSLLRRRRHTVDASSAHLDAASRRSYRSPRENLSNLETNFSLLTIAPRAGLKRGMRIPSPLASGFVRT